MVWVGRTKLTSHDFILHFNPVQLNRYHRNKYSQQKSLPREEVEADQRQRREEVDRMAEQAKQSGLHHHIRLRDESEGNPQLESSYVP